MVECVDIVGLQKFSRKRFALKNYKLTVRQVLSLATLVLHSSNLQHWSPLSSVR